MLCSGVSKGHTLERFPHKFRPADLGQQSMNVGRTWDSARSEWNRTRPEADQWEFLITLR
jgi:hypothetical protein